MSSTPSPFLESVSRFMAVRRYNKRTIEAYLYWIKYFIIFHEKRHPSEMSVPKISGSGLAFSPAISGKKGLVRGGTFWLLFLAVEKKCARALTRN